MTTVDVNKFTRPCGMGAHCRHSICADCGEALRANDTAAAHPNTKHQYVTGNCKTCFLKNTRLTEADLLDQRHVLLSDREMARIYDVNTFMYDWHLRRRYRLKVGEAAA